MYRVVPDDAVNDQIAALPAVALAAFAEARTLLEIAPWSGRALHSDNPEGAVRLLPFGGFGALICLILERDREVHPLVVQWLG